MDSEGSSSRTVEDGQSAVSQLAQAVVSTNWEALSPEVQGMALNLFLDSLAVMAAGSAHPDMRSLRESIAPSPGPCTIFGDSVGANIQDAVLLNGSTITVLQRQDGYSRMKGHPAIQLAAVLLALGEKRKTHPKDLLNAFVGGYEAAARIGLGMGGVPFHLHDIGNWVTIGVSAAATALTCSGDATAVASAIDGASSLGLHFDRWTTTAGATLHHLYPAVACITALNVARGVEAGLSARADTLSSFYGPFLADGFNGAAMLEGVVSGAWAKYEILKGYYKLYPSCAHLHGVNDAIAALLEDEPFSEDDVRRVDVRLFDEGIAIDCSAPKNDLDARFSAKATVATAIRFGTLDDPGLLELEYLRPLMDLINVSHGPELDAHKPSGRPGTVKVELKSGRVISRTVIHPRGTPHVPVTESQRLTKAMGLLGRVYGASGAERILEEVYSIPQASSLEGLTASLRAAGSGFPGGM